MIPPKHAQESPSVSDQDKTRWNERYRAGGGATAPATFLLSLDDVLPRHGRALDLAGGRGRHALWLARRGLSVTLADVADEGLALARSAAALEGIELTTLEVDLEAELVPPGPWDLILSFHYLHRPLLGRIAAALAPGGLFVFCHPTRANLERHPRPGPRHLLEEGELPGLVAGLEFLRYEEGWTEEGRHEARLVAARPGGAP